MRIGGMNHEHIFYYIIAFYAFVFLWLEIESY